ncbi:MAG: methyl-viologen-reducing hydrogenase subunit delta [Candidatus Neomarinimicrobiota bacterium]|nr:hydrogenase iron-sulfur subunit [Candidatus Neomarinimicrobiota bacterium]RKY50754.1 MAG: methyl-viologen-reducing hydrogenase subunit delta [Candidatus Neomarinimicrobiota bacterium]
MIKPKIIAFYCKWCTSAGADLAGTSRLTYPPNVIPVRVMCSSRVDAEHVLEAFKNGADGVLIGGCHPGDCHYETGNYQTLKRVTLLKKMLEDLNIDPRRLRLEWVSAAEGKRFTEVVKEFTEEIAKLGELKVEKL